MSSWEQTQLAAGGFVSMNSKIDEAVTEPVVARTYGGEPLGDRVVVRLSADRLGPAEDLAMEYLGLEPRDVSAPLAKQTKRALGFANWALTYYPENAKYALGLIKRIKATARRAKTKPGHAWDEFVEMAGELNKSVRHFLPTFWEEAGRIFKDVGNPTYAGRSLGRALEAERVHALDIDREHRRDAVLEFTLSGCLSGKALSEYAKDLQTQFDPSEAYATLRDLVVRRTRGGMPPTGNLGKDLLRLLKATDLDANEEMEAVLMEIIPAPSMSRAPMQFWKSVKSYVKRLVSKSETFAIWLLVHTEPQSRYSGDSMVWAWLDLLDECGALPFIWKPELPAEPEVPGGRAGWIARLARVETSPPKRLLELIESTADVIKREGKPCPLFARGKWRGPRLDADVVEAFLDLEIETDAPDEGAMLDFDGWLRADIDHSRRNSSLENIIAHEQLGFAFRRALPELLRFTGESTRTGYHYGRTVAARRSFSEAAEAHQGVIDAWWQHLDRQLKRVESGGVPDAEVGLENLRTAISTKGAKRFPELLERLEKIDLVDNLHRTLVAGVLDEYGWDAFDKAAAQTPLPVSRGYSDKSLYWPFPHVAYCSNGQVVIVHPDKAAKPRDLQLAKSQHLLGLIPVQDDVLVYFRDSEREWAEFIRWMSDPQTDSKQRENRYHVAPQCVVAKDDGVVAGGRSIRPGDTSIERPNKFFHDGERFWRFKKKDYSHTRRDEDVTLIEFDPDSGSNTRASIPPWFEEDLPSGASILFQQSELLPAPTDDSPLGVKDGLIGWRLIRRRDGKYEGQGIDGRRCSLNNLNSSDEAALVQPLAMMQKPAHDSHWIFATGGRVFDSITGMCLADLSSDRTSYRAGQPADIPTSFLHLMQVRHPVSSKRLRKLKRGDAQKLLDEGQAQSSVDPTKGDKFKDAAVAKLLKGAPSLLTQGIASIAWLAASEASKLDKLRTTLAASESPESGDEGVLDASTGGRIGQGLQQLGIPTPARSYFSSYTSTDNEEHLRETIKFLSGKREGSLPPCDLPWLNLFKDLPTLVWTCFWKLGTSEEAYETVSLRLRQPWLDLLEFIARSGVLDLPGGIRIHECDKADANANKRASYNRDQYQQPVDAWLQGENRYLVQYVPSHPNPVAHVLEYSPSGKFAAPDGFTVQATHEARTRWSGEQLLEFVEAVRTLEELPFATNEQIENAAAELEVTPAEVAIVWMANLRTVRYGSDKLTKGIRDHYHWKVKPVAEAISALEASPPPANVISAAIDDDPASTIKEGQPAAFAKVVEAWKDSRPKVRISPELIDILQKKANLRSAPLIQMIEDGEDSNLLCARKFEFELESRGNGYHNIELHFEPPRQQGDFGFLSELSYLFYLVNYHTPSGDPARNALPGCIEAIRTFLDRPDAILPFGYKRTQTDYRDTDVEETIDRLTKVLGKFEKGDDGLLRSDDGFIAVALIPPDVSMVFRSAQLHEPGALDRLTAAASLTFNWERSGEQAIHFARNAIEMRSEAMTQLQELNRNNPVPDGSWDQNPLLSAPELVSSVAKKLKMEEPSACLYLQILALLDPTVAHLRAWNNWTPKQLKSAVQPLIENEHLVEAKRARAGRTMFLPGGWEALKTPNLPLETWKLKLYDLTPERLELYRHRLIAPKNITSELFQRAWERVTHGDPPQYEEAS